jgi:hypothetical protein
MKKIILLAQTFIITALTMSCVAQDNWISFEGHGYKILFPKKPTDESQDIVTAVGKLKMNNYMYEVPETAADDNLTYGATELLYPDSLINSDRTEILDKFFRGSVDGAVGSVHGKLLTETIIQLDGYPGREFRVEVKDGMAVITMRAYLVKNRMYMLQVITDTKRDFNKSIGRFLDSFTLKH